MDRASGNRARYRRTGSSASSRWFRPGWIGGGALICVVGLALAYPVWNSNKGEGAGLAVLAVVPLVVALTMKPGTGRGRLTASIAGIAVFCAGYGGLYYTANYAPHSGYSVSITGGASLTQVLSEIRVIASSHALAADTSFSSDRIKVDFPNGDPAAVAATIGELRHAAGVASVEGCRGTLC
jgi:hypothetical protein